MKRMTYKEWMKLKKKLKNEYHSVDDVIVDCDKTFEKHYGTIFLGLNKMLMVRPVAIEDDDHLHLSRDTALFRKKNNIWVYVDTKALIDELVNHLKEHVSVEKIIEDALCDTDPDELEEIFDRVVNKKGKIREEEGCYKLIIGGKRGQPMEFMLRE